MTTSPRYACDDAEEITKRIKELRAESGVPTCSCPKDSDGRRVGRSEQCKVHGDA
jgi:hypothetical protein